MKQKKKQSTYHTAHTHKTTWKRQKTEGAPLVPDLVVDCEQEKCAVRHSEGCGLGSRPRCDVSRDTKHWKRDNVADEIGWRLIKPETESKATVALWENLKGHLRHKRAKVRWVLVVCVTFLLLSIYLPNSMPSKKITVTGLLFSNS